MFVSCHALTVTPCNAIPGETCVCILPDDTHRGEHRCRCHRTWANTRGMVRRTDPVTSAAAASVVAIHLSELQDRILEAFREHGPMHGRQVERLPEFEDCAPSTVRRRITDLARMNQLEACGTDTSGRAPITIYRVPRS